MLTLLLVSRGEKKAENQMVVINYWCQTVTTEITLSSEHDACQWITPEEALTITDDPNLQRTIQRFVEEKRIMKGRMDI